MAVFPLPNGSMSSAQFHWDLCVFVSKKIKMSSEHNISWTKVLFKRSYSKGCPFDVVAWALWPARCLPPDPDALAVPSLLRGGG